MYWRRGVPANRPWRRLLRCLLHKQERLDGEAMQSCVSLFQVCYQQHPSPPWPLSNVPGNNFTSGKSVPLVTPHCIFVNNSIIWLLVPFIHVIILLFRFTTCMHCCMYNSYLVAISIALREWVISYTSAGRDRMFMVYTSSILRYTLAFTTLMYPPAWSCPIVVFLFVEEM